MRPLAAVLLSLLLTAQAACADAADAEQQRAALERLRSQIAGLQDEIAAKRSARSGLTNTLHSADQEIARAAQQLRRLDQELAQQRERLLGLEAERAAQAQALLGHRAALAAQARAAYAMGRQERLKILLNQQDPATVSRAMVYYDYLSRARARKMALIREQLGQLADTEDAIRQEEQRLAALRAQRSDELAQMEAAQQQRRSLVEALARELADQGEQLQRLQADERDLEGLLERLEQVLADIPLDQPQAAFAEQRGRLAWPARGQLLARFGTPRLGRLRWDGVMIGAAEGQEVRAVHHGRVAFADWLRGFGLLLIIDHGDGYMTLYGHNQALFKEPGDWVDVNEAVALVGSSGGRERAGVYFGIRHQGRAVDPASWCRGPSSAGAG